MNKRIINIVIFVVSAIIIAFFIPVNGVFRYDFVLGEEWRDNTLVAPYDFPINKTDIEYSQDIAGFEKLYRPIYNRNNLVKADALEGLKHYYSITSVELLKKNYKTLPIDRRRAVTIFRTLTDIYNVGIIDLGHDNTVSTNDNFVVRIVDKDQIKSRSKTNIYDVKSAKEKLHRVVSSLKLLNKGASLVEADQYIMPNVLFDEELNSYTHKSELDEISITKGFIKKGSVIVRAGQIIDNDKYVALQSFEKEHYRLGGREFSIIPFLGNLLYVLIVFALSYFSLFTFNREFLDSIRNVIFLMLLYISLILMSVFIVNFNFIQISVYTIPFAIFPFYINNFYGSKVSIYQYIFLLLIASTVTSFPFEFLLINYLSGLAGMYILQRAHRRLNFVFAVLVTLLVSIMLYTILTFISHGEILEGSTYIWFGVNSILLIALYQLIYVIEKVFKFVSSITLIELCDTNQKLLSELAILAPGTFQHSMQVANLCETAAKAIGANHLLARTGAMYHDIGKFPNGMMFTENNSGDSLHSKLTDLQSVEVIRNHVVDGVRLANRNNLPSKVSDFISTHHGDSLIYYFYRSYVDKHPDEDVDESMFRYPGPKPSTREQTICMMADAIEAASRTLKDYTDESISNLVDNIIKTQMEGGQYSNSCLSFKELDIVKEAFKSKVTNIYHSRVEYPK